MNFKDIQKNITEKYNSLCFPSKIYTILALIGLLISIVSFFNSSSPTLLLLFGILLRIIFYLFWTWVLDSLCKKGYTTASWILLALPYILVILFSFALVSVFLIDLKYGKGKTSFNFSVNI